jgi:hypothetical protein
MAVGIMLEGDPGRHCTFLLLSLCFLARGGGRALGAHQDAVTS